MTYILLQNTPLGLDPIWWWVFSFGAFILGWFLHWLLFSRGKQEIIDRVTGERDTYHTASTKWESDYNSLKYQLEELQKADADLRTNLQRCEADKEVLRFKLERAEADGGHIAADTAQFLNTGVAADGVMPGESVGERDMDEAPNLVAAAAAGTEVRHDDLKIVEGIGPKIENLLHEAGIHTWEQLSGTPVGHLREILAEGGERYRLANPETWPRQARLAAEGRWEELKELQASLLGGRE